MPCPKTTKFRQYSETYDPFLWEKIADGNVRLRRSHNCHWRRRIFAPDAEVVRVLPLTLTFGDGLPYARYRLDWDDGECLSIARNGRGADLDSARLLNAFPSFSDEAQAYGHALYRTWEIDMTHTATRLDRRVLLSAGAAGAVALVGLTGLPRQARAAPTAEETANVKLVKEFCKTAEDEKPDVDKLMAFFSDDCLMNFGPTVPITKGKADCTALLKTFYTHGERYGLKITETVARGPVVLTMRQDTTTKDGKTSKPISVFGVFYVKNGKIKEWTDFT